MYAVMLTNPIAKSLEGLLSECDFLPRNGFGPHSDKTYPYKPNFIWIGLWIGEAEPGNDSGESASLQGFNGRNNSGTVDDPLAVQSIPPKK